MYSAGWPVLGASTGWPVKQGRVFLVPCSVYATVTAYTGQVILKGTRKTRPCLNGAPKMAHLMELKSNCLKWKYKELKIVSQVEIQRT